MPELPALAEALPGFDVTIWYGLAAPARTPRPVIDRLAALTAAFLAQPSNQAKLGEMGLAPAPQGPEAFGAFIRAEIPRWTAAAREAGIEPQ
jgi:tripartite-type tricarboxylate transporter receptor subunit TctC